jgi:hypothetical protein
LLLRKYGRSGDDEAVLILLGELSRGADDLIDKPCQINGLGIEFELAGFDLRELPHNLAATMAYA